MSQKHIIVCIDTFSFTPMGGAGRYMWEVIKRLAGRGNEITVICERREDIEHEDEIDGVRFYCFDREQSQLARLKSARRNFPKLFTKAAELKPPAAVNFHNPLPFYFIYKDPRCSLPHNCVYTFHSSWADEHVSRRMRIDHGFLRNLFLKCGRLSRQWIENWAFRRLNRFVVLSEYSKDVLTSKFPVEPSRIDLVPGAADTVFFCEPENRDKIREQFGFGPSETILLTIRRLDPRMGVVDLVKAFSIVSREIDNVRLVIGGSGPQESEIRGLINQHSLQERILMPGYISDDDLPLLLGAADLFVMPTLELEGFGLVTVEAMATGTPVIATPVGANTEILGKIDHDLLFKSASVSDMASGICRVLIERKDLLSNRKHWRDIVENQYNWKLAADRYEEIFLTEEDSY